MVFQKWQIFGIKKYCQKNWQIFWKTVIFGDICQIWHHLATQARGWRPDLNPRPPMYWLKHC